MSIFDVLREVAARPELHVGADSESRDEQLRNLQWFILGVQAALDESAPGKHFVLEFGAYLRKRFGWSVASGPIAAVMDAHADSQEAWRAFWELVADFETSVSSASKVGVKPWT